MAIQLQRHRFTVAEYQRMVEVGLFTTASRVELLDGEIIDKMAMNPPHGSNVMRLINTFVRILGSRAIVTAQTPIVLDDYSAPEPDITLLVPRDDFYATAHPRSDDIFLVIEVCDSSLPLDRIHKLPLYAAAGIREVWLIDTNTRRIEVHQQPTAQGYQFTRLVGREERLSPLAFPDLDLVVAELIG
jgi:Uma2 family endonuclease